MEAGRILGMTDESGSEEVLYHEGELDMAIQSDFAIHEIEDDGRTCIERFIKQSGGTNKLSVRYSMRCRTRIHRYSKLRMSIPTTDYWYWMMY